MGVFPITAMGTETISFKSLYFSTHYFFFQFSELIFLSLGSVTVIMSQACKCLFIYIPSDMWTGLSSGGYLYALISVDAHLLLMDWDPKYISESGESYLATPLLSFLLWDMVLMASSEENFSENN